MRRIVWTPSQWKALAGHFESSGKREDGAFLLIRSGISAQGERILVQRLLLPPKGALERQGQDFLRPSGQWLSSVIGSAVDARCGLAFIHSHPDPSHPPGLSSLDWDTSIRWSRTLAPMLDGPFASLVWSPRGVAGLVFDRGSPGSPKDIERAIVVGNGAIESLDVINSHYAQEAALDDRQIRALRIVGNTRLRNLDVGVVGAGGTGSPLAEQLVRLGVASVVLIDPDVVEQSNLRRIVGSRTSDIGSKKAEVVARYLDTLGLATKITALTDDVRHGRVVRRLLDCDIVMSTTDTQSSRALLNQVSYQYWLPLIDVGVRIGTSKDGGISGMPAEVRTLLPDNGCMWCRKGVLSSQAIYEENLPKDEREELAKEGYVQGLGAHQPSLAPLNYLASALAVLTLIRLYSGKPLQSASIIFDGWEQFVHPLPSIVDENCICASWRGKADDLPIAFLPEPRLEDARSSQ